MVGAQSFVVRLAATCDLAGATEAPSDQLGARRYERTDPGRSGPATTWYIVFEGGCVTAQFGSANDVDAALATQASSGIGFVTRAALQQALDERSDGRLQLDPDGVG